MLDEHQETVAVLSVRLDQFISSLTIATDPEHHRIASKRLSQLNKSVTAEIGEIKNATGDMCLIRQ